MEFHLELLLLMNSYFPLILLFSTQFPYERDFSCEGRKFKKVFPNFNFLKENKTKQGKFLGASSDNYCKF